MKFISLLLALIFASSAIAAAPYGLAGQNQSVTYPNVHKAPFSQITNLGGINSLIETGNKNMLINPGFEHTTVGTGWTTATTGPAVSITKWDSTDGTPYSAEYGKKSAFLGCNGTSGGAGYCSFYQDVTTSSKAQGIIWARIWGETGTTYSFHPRTNGVTDTSAAKSISIVGANTWGFYPLPHILGSTSTGLEVRITVGASTSTLTVADDMFVGVANLLDADPIIGPWTSYTPTFTGFGTVTTPEMQWRQVGSNIEIRGKFISGTSTAVEARISLPNSYTSAGTGVIPTIQVAGYGVINANTATQYYTLIEPGVTYLTFGLQGGANSGITKVNGSTLLSSTQLYSFSASLPVAGLQSAVSTYSSQCGTACQETFSAKVSITGVVTDEAGDWINGNTALASSIFTITPNTGIFTVAPNCVATHSGGGSQRTIGTTSSAFNSIQISTWNGAGIADVPFLVFCQKQGVDLLAARTLKGTFKEVSVFPGIDKPKTCMYSFGGASATLASPTECTTGTCVEVYDSCASASPPTFSGTAIYNNLTFANGTWANSTPLKCECTAFDTTVTGRWCNFYNDTGDQTWATNSSGGAVLNISGNDLGGANATSFVQIKCTAAAP